MKRVLVLDASQRSALAVTRSLGRHSVQVFTAEEFPVALAGCSRFSGQYFTYPSPRLYPDQFTDFLVNLVKKQHIDMLMPMTELTTTLLLTRKDSFPGTILPFPDINTIERLSDKCSLMHMAQSLNIPVPHTWYADNAGSLPVDLGELPYPVVLKPGKSWQCQQGQWNRAAVQIAQSQTEAKTILDRDSAFSTHPFMIQEYIAGHGEGVFALYDHGESLAFFAHRRLREKPPSGGVSVLSKSIAVDPLLRSHTRLLLDKASWHGIAMVEFKVAPDGTPYLMEINTRFWGSLQLAIDAGVDFPWLLYQLACGDRPAPVDSYKVGLQLRWLLGDLDNLYLTLRDKEYSFGAKLSALGRFITPSPFRTRHEVDRWNDPNPAWHEIRLYLREVL
jgi:predicted ATP-grasp superfamily ATP-dependent carboligase